MKPTSDADCYHIIIVVIIFARLSSCYNIVFLSKSPFEIGPPLNKDADFLFFSLIIIIIKNSTRTRSRVEMRPCSTFLPR